MSTRPQISPFDAFDSNTGQSVAISITGNPTIIQKLSMLSYAFDWNGTGVVGAISVEVSNDFKLDASGKVENAGTWNVLPLNLSGSSVNSIPIATDTDNGFIDIEQCAAYAIRPVYTATAGTGTINCKMIAKVA